VPSEAFAKALKEKGCRVTTREIKDSTHIRIFMNAASTGGVVSDAILDFIRTHAKKQTLRR
jgi:hypothetical protein